MNLSKALLVFGVIVALDYAWTRYTVAVGAKSRHVAACYAVCIYAFSGVATISYTKDPWLLIPALIGSYVGTYIALRK